MELRRAWLKNKIVDYSKRCLTRFIIFSFIILVLIAVAIILDIQEFPTQYIMPVLFLLFAPLSILGLIIQENLEKKILFTNAKTKAGIDLSGYMALALRLNYNFARKRVVRAKRDIYEALIDNYLEHKTFENMRRLLEAEQFFDTEIGKLYSQQIKNIPMAFKLWISLVEEEYTKTFINMEIHNKVASNVALT